MTPLFLDYETASAADIKLGGRYYARHPSTRIVCAVAKCDHVTVRLRHDTPVELFVTGVMEQTGATHIVAHNGDSFDRFIAARFMPALLELPWLDTIHMARAGGLPAGLDDLGRWFFQSGKDDAGYELMKKVCKLERQNDGSWSNKWWKPGYLAAVLRYCEQDVVLLERLLPKLLPYHRPAAVELDRRINDRGIGFDEKLAASIAECSAALMAESLVEIARITKGKLTTPTDLRSQVKMPAWLASQGIKLENFAKSTVKRFIDESIYIPVGEIIAGNEELEPLGEQINDVTKRVMELRSSALRITASKLEKASAVCLDGRLYDLRVHGGAHTTRRTGRIVQPHNLPGGVEGLDIEHLSESLCLDSVRAEAQRLQCSPDDVLSSLIRPTLIPAKGHSFVIADFAQVELRIAAWMAGERVLLDTFRTGGDPYVTAASKLFKVDPADVTKTQRKVGKIEFLAGQYQGGAGTFNVFALNNGVKFDEIGMTANEIVEGYRDSFPDIAGSWTGSYFKGVKCRKGGVWRALDKAFRAAIEGEVVTTNKIMFRPAGGNVEMVMPSGKTITYRKPAVEIKHFPGDDEPRKCLMYNHPVKGRRDISPGVIFQNCCEAIGNDLLNIPLQYSEDKGYRPVLEVHDELIDEVPSATAPKVLDELLDVMGTIPAWAEGLPLAATGHTAPRYTKSPWKGFYRRD